MKDQTNQLDAYQSGHCHRCGRLRTECQAIIDTGIRCTEKPKADVNDLDGDSDHYSTSELAHYRAIEASKEIL